MNNNINNYNNDYYNDYNNDYNHYNNDDNNDTSVNTLTQCSICMTRPNNYVNTTCGHICVCNNCLPRIGNTCPICRQTGNYIRVYNSGIPS